MRDNWRGLNKLHAEICSLSVRFEAVSLCEGCLKKGDGKGNRYGI